MSEKIALLVLSCDKYKSLWEIFFGRLSKYWPDFPGKIYLLSNYAVCDWENVTTLPVGNDVDWSSNLAAALDIIAEEDILVFMEDAPLDSKVDTFAFMKLYEKFINLRMNYLNMKATPLVDSTSLEQQVCYQPKGTLYRTAIVPCLWKKDILKKLLIEGESAWEFEIAGSERSNYYDNFFVTKYRFFTLVHIIIRGQIDRRAYKILRLTGELSQLSFPIMNRIDYLKLILREIRSWCLSLLPYNKRMKIRKFFLNEKN